MNTPDFLSLLYYAASAERSAPIESRNVNQLYERTQGTAAAWDPVNNRLERMDEEEADALNEDITALVEEFERQGFINGFRLGAMLRDELSMGATGTHSATATKSVGINDKDLVLMDEFMQCIRQTDEWQERQTGDPMIAAAEARWLAAMEQAEALISKKLYNELCESHYAEVSDTGDAGILFGIHVADAIRDAAPRPAGLSRHIMERMEGRA